MLRAAAVSKCGCIALAVSLTLGAASLHAAPSTKPNVILFLADDQGWTGTSVVTDPAIPDSTSDFYETPRLAGLAAEGTRFAAGYAPASICAPTRWSIQTGRGPAWATLKFGTTTLYQSTTTIAEALKAADPDYVAAHLGKWHLRSDPGVHGYDVHDGDTSGSIPAYETEPDNPKDTFGISSRALAFMTEQVVAGRPFYLQISHYAVHAPLEALSETVADYEGKPPGVRHSDVDYGAMTEDLDTGLGIVLDALDALGIADRTYVIYTSDNGAALLRSDNSPLAGGKTRLWEGGIRVPFVVRGPGISAAAVSHVPVIGWDILPTVLDWIGAPDAVPPAVEGGSLRPLLEAGGMGSVTRTQNAFVWHSPRHSCDDLYIPHSAIRLDQYKAIRFYETGEFVLYDVEADPGETQDLAAEMPTLASQLAAQLDAYLETANADPPVLSCRRRKGGCGLGAELAFLLPPLLWLHGRRRRIYS
jgi:arylsulfatase A-like enzyme